MFKSINQWIKKEICKIISGYIPPVVIIIFGMFAVTYIPDIAWGATAIFAIVFYIIYIWFIDKKHP